ncbi:hypothetical protein V6Z12_D12G095100 [Gossypium hirsutum]
MCRERNHVYIHKTYSNHWRLKFNAVRCQTGSPKNPMKACGRAEPLTPNFPTAFTPFNPVFPPVHLKTKLFQLWVLHHHPKGANNRIHMNNFIMWLVWIVA